MIFRENEQLLYGASLKFFPEKDDCKNEVFFSENFFKVNEKFLQYTQKNKGKANNLKVQVEFFVLDKSFSEEKIEKNPSNKYIKTIMVTIVDGSIFSLISEKINK